MELVDSHCHLDFPEFETECAAVIARAQEKDIAYFLTVSTKIREITKLQTIAERFAPVFFSVGTHPYYADQEADITAAEIVTLTQHPKLIALGESGLDYHRETAPKGAQQESFLRHIDVAQRTGLPLIIHTRDADEDTGKILQQEMKKAPFKALLHCFSSGENLAWQALDLGLYISFSGILTFKQAEHLRILAAKLPLERLLVETDAPYLAPLPFRGKRNEPAYVRYTAQMLAQSRKITLKKVARQTTKNFFTLFDKARMYRALHGTNDEL